MQFDHSSAAKANILTVLDQHATEKYKMGQIFYVIFLRVEKKRKLCPFYIIRQIYSKTCPIFVAYIQSIFFLKCVAFYMILQIATKMYPIFVTFLHIFSQGPKKVINSPMTISLCSEENETLFYGCGVSFQGRHTKRCRFLPKVLTTDLCSYQ